ncbi:hypothetical protein ACTFIR_007494 [Dictyostelium discoideum]
MNPENITLVVFMGYLTHLFKENHLLDFYTIYSHSSMNQTDIINDPLISKIMTGIHKSSPSSTKYKEIMVYKLSNNVDVPTDYQLCDTLLSQYKLLVNNQGLLVEECILKKDEISELNEVFNFPSDFQVNVAPFDTRTMILIC